MNPIQRIEYILSLVNLPSLNALAKSIGIKSSQVFYDLKSGKVKSISSELATSICSKYPNFNLSWVLSGEGEPINEGFYLGENPMISKAREEQKTNQSNNLNLIPMYNFPASAGETIMYNNPNDVKIVGHLNIPGATKDSFALPAYGHSMYPTLSNGDWGIVRPIEDKTEIVWGEIYYIEWSEYRMYKRLLLADNNDEVILWSDNQEEKTGDRIKYASIIIKKDKIRKLCLVTEILKKPNY